MPGNETMAVLPGGEHPIATLPRVLHLRSSGGLYGAEGVICGLARGYSGPCRVLCLKDARDPHTELCERLVRDGQDAGALPSRGAIDPALVFRFGAEVRRYRPDVIHTHDYKSDTIAWLASFLPGPRPRLVATMHGVVRTSAALRGYERLDARVLRRFGAIAAVSEGTAETARSYGILPERIHVIPNGVDTEVFRPGDRAAARHRLGIAHGLPLLGVVGRLSPEKGQNVLLDALALTTIPAELAVVGDGPMNEELRRRAGGGVHFLGRREDMPDVFAALDLLVLPSLSEGLPLTILEAAACGVPAVASRVGDVEKVVRPIETGMLVPPGDARALASALDEALSDLTRLETMGRAARAHVVAHFSEAATTDNYTRLYQTVLSKRRART